MKPRFSCAELSFAITLEFNVANVNVVNVVHVMLFCMRNDGSGQAAFLHARWTDRAGTNQSTVFHSGTRCTKLATIINKKSYYLLKSPRSNIARNIDQ